MCGPGLVAQLVGASSHTPKGCRFDSGQDTPRLWVRSSVGVHTGGNQLMFLSFFLSPSVSLPAFLSL